MFKKIVIICFFFLCACQKEVLPSVVTINTLKLELESKSFFKATESSNDGQLSTDSSISKEPSAPPPIKDNQETTNDDRQDTSPSPGGQTPPDKNHGQQGEYDEDLEQAIVDLVNDLRVSLGINVLEVSQGLTKTAELKSEDMAINQYFSHEGNLTFAKLLEQQQIVYQISGENIFRSQNPLLDASEVFEAWEQSPSHYANMTNAQFTKIGLGVYVIEEEGVRTYYVTQHLTD